MTEKEARLLIELNKSNTAWYGKHSDISYNQMYDMLKKDMGFGKAETICILAALKLSGSTIGGELTRDEED